jgi:SAM-dependent methyltransferase
MFWKVGYFCRDLAQKYGPFTKVLDVGSLDENGNLKDFIPDLKEYIGIDMRPGKNVDLVLNGHDITKQWKKPTFDAVFCLETLEHDDQFWVTVENMKAVLKSGGWLVVTSPGINFFKHNFPSDYYRFTPEAFKDFVFKGMEEVYVEKYFDKDDPVHDKPNNTVLGYGRKP